MQERINCPICQSEIKASSLEIHFRQNHTDIMDMLEFMELYPAYKQYLKRFKIIKTQKVERIDATRNYRRRA